MIWSIILLRIFNNNSFVYIFALVYFNLPKVFYDVAEDDDTQNIVIGFKHNGRYLKIGF